MSETAHERALRLGEGLVARIYRHTGRTLEGQERETVQQLIATLIDAAREAAREEAQAQTLLAGLETPPPPPRRRVPTADEIAQRDPDFRRFLRRREA